MDTLLLTCSASASRYVQKGSRTRSAPRSGFVQLHGEVMRPSFGPPAGTGYLIVSAAGSRRLQVATRFFTVIGGNRRAASASEHASLGRTA